MNFFVFRSGVPFAYLAFQGALLAAVSIGTIVCMMRWRATPRRPIWVPAGVALAALAIGGVNMFVGATLNLNPMITDAEIVGEWTDDGAVLTLQGNGAFSCHGGTACSTLGASGRWARRQDHELSFRAAGGSAVIRRVVQMGSLYHLTDMPEDPDMWDGALTFQRSARVGPVRS